MAPRLAPQGIPALARDAGARLVVGEVSADRLPGHRLLLGAEAAEEAREPGRGRSQAHRDLREARDPAGRAEATRGSRRRCRLRQRVGGHHLPGGARQEGHPLLLLLRGRARAPGSRATASRVGGSLRRQQARSPQLGGLHRRLLRLRSEGRPLPDGAFDVFQDQRRQYGPVRADPHHRGRGQLRLLPRGLHGAPARREPASRRRRRARCARACRDQVLDGAELVSRRRRRPRRHLQLRDQAWQVPRTRIEDLVDPGRDGLGHHLEVSELSSSSATIRSASSTRSPSRRTTSRRTPAPR